VPRYLILVLVACGVDKAPIHETPLDGGIHCVHVSCGADQLCVERTFAVDAGVQDDCVTPGPGCPVFDCTGDGCPSCITQLCGSGPQPGTIDVEGRILSCPTES